MEDLSGKHYCRGKAISIAYCGCVFATLISQHVVRMDCIILSDLACLIVPNVSTLSYKWHDFWKKVIGRKMCVLIFCINFVCNISYSMLLVRHYRKCIFILMKSAIYSCQKCIKLEFYLKIFEKYSSVMFHEITSSGKLMRRLFMDTCITLMNTFITYMDICITYMDICITFMDTCIKFVDVCITFMDICVTFMDTCINLWIHVLIYGYMYYIYGYMY
jgi:hypothetical protein